MGELRRRLAGVPAAQAFAFAPPAVPGIGTAGGVTFMLEDRAGKDPAFLAESTAKFLEAARKRPEFSLVFTTLLPSVPQLFAQVDRDKVLKQGIELSSVYQTLQAFLGGTFVNYFNRFGRVWQVYVQAEGDFRTKAENVGQFYVRNASGESVPLSTLVSIQPGSGASRTGACRSRSSWRPRGCRRPPCSASRCWWCSCSWPPCTRAGRFRSPSCSPRPSPCSAPWERCGSAASSSTSSRRSACSW